MKYTVQVVRKGEEKGVVVLASHSRENAQQYCDDENKIPCEHGLRCVVKESE